MRHYFLTSITMPDSQTSDMLALASYEFCV